MKTSSTNDLHAGKYFPRPVAESTALRFGVGVAVSWVSSFPGPLLVVGDANTLAALRHLGAGGRTGDAVVDLGTPTRLDDALVAAARSALRGHRGHLVAVGGGTINDLGKILAAERGEPFALLATCASMNGWVSSNASIVRSGNKISVPAIAPAEVVLDTGLLGSAPPALSAAGVADALSGFYACRDWRLASWADATPYDAGIAEAVRASLAPLDANAAKTDGAALPLVEALLTGGLAMHEAHTSAPASGAEHLVAHAIDLAEIARGAAPTLHGHAVAIGSLLVAALWEELGAFDAGGSFHAIVDATADDVDARTAGVARFLPTLAAEAAAIARAKAAKEAAWPDARDLLARALTEPAIPGVEALRARLVGAGAPTRAHEVHVDRAFLRGALLHARDMRDRTTVFDLAFALGVLPARADAVVDRSGLV
jgi:glycerol-1-phosphate dehydrogenase [NAD(P)+]